MVAVIAVYLISLALVWPVGDFPLLDDWVYARSAVVSAEAGRFAFTGYESAWSLPQIIIGTGLTKLIGPSHRAFRGLGVISLIIVVLVLNAYMRKGPIAANLRPLLCGLLLFNPVVYLLSMTFMSDLPFLVFWVGASFAWDSALTTRSRMWIIAAICLTSLAIAQRQFGIFIPCTVLILILWLYKRPQQAALASPTYLLILLLAVIMTFCIGATLWLWMDAQGGYQPPIFSSNPFSYFIPSNFKMTVLLTLALLPACILIDRSRDAGRQYFLVGRAISALIAACGLYFLTKDESILYGNLLSPFGIARPNELVLGERPVIFGTWMNRCALVFAVSMFCVTISAMLKSYCRFFSKGSANAQFKGESPKVAGSFGMVLAGSTCLYLAAFSLRGGFDRYLVPALPGLIVIAAGAIAGTANLQLRAAYGALAVMAALSVALSYDYFRWNEAKWQAAQELVASGVPSAKIHAGYEWHGWYHGDTSPFPGGMSSGYSHFISFSNSYDSLSVKAEKEWRGLLPPFRQRMFVLEKNNPDITHISP